MTTAPVVRPVGETADEAILRYIGCWQRRDTQALLSMFAPNGRYTDPNFPNSSIGVDALGPYAQAFFDAVPDLSFEVVQHGLTHPDGAALRWVMTGTHTGPLGPLAPRNGRFELPGCDFIRLEHGLIVEALVLFDQKLFLEQAGYPMPMAA